MFKDQTGLPGAPESKRVVRIRLDGRRYRLLQRLAAEIEIPADQLAALWLRDRIDETAGRGELLRVADELAEIRDSLAQLAAGDGNRRRGARRPADRPARTRTAATQRRRGSLHNEIVTVLQQRGEPMTAAEIADAIRQRDNYRAPRSGHPITGAAVSRRIANPYYRSLFERRGRSVGLAHSHER